MEIGQSVKVLRLRDRLSSEAVAKLKENPVGQITDYKVVDGSGVGFVVSFGNGFATWFFEDELEANA